MLWPWYIRLIHWGLALIILLDAFVLEEGDPPHRYIGYVAVGLILIRFFFGFFGKGKIHFKEMSIHPKKILFFLKTHFTREHHFEGHNPLASLVYYVMWIDVILLAVTGWLLGTDKYFGDEGIEVFHGQLSDALIALVVIHLLGMILDAILYKRKTWMGMISGKADSLKT